MMQTNSAPRGPQADFAGVLVGTAQLMIDAIAGAIDGGRAVATDIAALCAGWHTRAEQRRHLAELDDHILADIGIDRARALEEASKPFWQR